MRQELTLATVGNIDGGRSEMVFNKLFSQAVRDCENRPFEGKARKVTIELMVVPVTDQDGEFIGVKSSTKLGHNVPNFVGREVSCMVEPGGKAIFDDLSPDDPHQRTIDDIGGSEPFAG